MIPIFVKYSGDLEFDPKVVFRCRKGIPIPTSWVRLSFVVKNFMINSDWQLQKWMDENLSGNYIINSLYTTTGIKVSVGFEDVNDAVMFRLMDGENFWQTELTVF